MTKATTNVARIAAAVAGLGLVAMSFAPAVGAQTTTTTTTTTTSASVTFTRDLTIGSTGADVTALQTWLIASGYSIPAGATGYFGTQTRAAVAAFQAANAITPAAGYFGPITRAKVASMGSTSTGTTSTVAGCMPGAAYSSTTGQPCTSTSTGTSGLTGGEASLSGYTLQSGNDIAQGDTDQEIAVAQFNVRGGDVNVQRVTVEMTGNASYSLLPWKYFTTLYVYNGNTKIGSVDVSSKSDWSQSGNTYSVDIPTNGIVRQGDNNQLSIRADAVNTIDSSNDAQVFALDIPQNGIRAVDAAGLQEYTGNPSDTVNVGITSAQNGKLNITTDTNSPSAGVISVDPTNTTSNQEVLAFDLRNSQNVAVDLNTITIHATSSQTALQDIIRRATLSIDGDTYTGTLSSGSTTTGTITFSNLHTTVNGNDSVTGTLSIDLYGQTGHYSTTGEGLIFGLNSSDVSAQNSDTGDNSQVVGSAQSQTQTIAVNTGISVSAGSNSASEAYNSTTPSNSTGTFALSFNVTANGSQDVYIPKTIGLTSSTTDDYTHGAGVADDLGASTVGTTSASLSSSADTDPNNSGYFVVHAGQTKTFTANVTMQPSAPGYYQIGLKDVNFTANANGSGLQNLSLNPNNFSSSQLYIH